ncbi:MAG: hypothetical protein GF313_11285 [Caldithrix sp.]|nr:hypothetical protein [Caldithrix sp.]
MCTKIRNGLSITVLFSIFSACATTNYYTAQTLKQGEKALSPGVDNVLLYESDTGDYTFGMTPSLGYVHGLPWRLETGLRLYVPYVLEGMVRRQLNPNRFSALDLSANLHFGIRYFFDNREAEIVDQYLKPGVTISKNIKGWQPFLSYYRILPQYRTGRQSGDHRPFNSVISTGIALPFGQDQIFPEINYQFRGAKVQKGIFFFGIGVRSFITKLKK